MTTNNPNLRVRISADLSDIKQGLGLLRGELAKVKQEAAQSIDLKGMSDGFNSLRSTLAGLFAGVTVGSVFRAVIQETRDASDEVAQLRAVLKSTGEQAGFTATQLTDMADKLADSTTHSSGEIVKAQTRLLSYTGIVGEQFSQALQMVIDQSARTGESIEQAAETVGKALDKPSQGVAALTKQGFKFTEAEKERMKVLEKSGRIGEAQKIVLDAMAESYGGAALAARNTFGGALTAVGSSLRELMDGSGGSGMGAATRALNELALALKSPEVREGFNNLATGVLNAVTGFAKFMAQNGVKYLRMLADAAAFTVKHIDVLAVAIGTYLAVQALPTAILGVQGLIKFLRTLRLALLGSTVAAKGLRAVLATMGGPITLAIAALTAGLYYLYQRTQEAKEAAEAHTEALRANKEMAKLSRDEALKDAQAKREQAMATVAAAKAALAQAAVQQREYQAGRGGGNLLGLQSSSQDSINPSVTKAKAALDAAQKQLDEWELAIFDLLTTGIEDMLKPVQEATTEAGKAIAKSNALLLDSATRMLAELDRLYADHAISIEDYYSRRVALQQKLIDLQIDQARSELSIAKELGARRTLEEQITKLQRDRAEIGSAAAREEKKAQDELTKSLGEVKLRLLELDGQTGRVERARLEEQYYELFKRLRAESNDTGAEMVANLIDRLVDKAKLDELKEVGAQITSALQSTETSVGAQVAGGMLGHGEGERQLQEVRARTLDQLRELRARTVEYLATLSTDSPEGVAALAYLQQLDTDISRVVGSSRKFAQAIEDQGVASLGDSLADLTTAAQGFKAAFADMVRSFVAGVARMIAQELALRAIKSLIGAWGGGGVGPVVKESIPIGSFHTGGIAGQPSRRIHVSPLLFGHAPRYHSGGIAGLKPDEVPAILQTGERVLSRRQTAMYDATVAAGSNAGRVTTPVVAIGDDAVANALAGAAGEDVVLTHVRNNWGGLQRGG